MKRSSIGPEPVQWVGMSGNMDEYVSGSGDTALRMKELF